MSNILNSIRVALVQMSVVKDKASNIQKAISMVHNASKQGSKVVVLPECFNYSYGTKYFEESAEEIPGGETCEALSNAAKTNGVYLIGGSIPEREGGKLYNTCTVWNPQGKLMAKHRKVHLFDIDIPGGITFKESSVLSPGNLLTVVDVGGCKVGLGICYDLRFQEMAALYRQQGVRMILYPGAFNMTTGPAHWELLLRARAVDNQVFVAGVCGARDLKADYIAWGHSMLVDPWGKILVQAEYDEALLVHDVDLKYADTIRQQIPVGFQRRTDLYDTSLKAAL